MVVVCVDSRTLVIAVEFIIEAIVEENCCCRVVVVIVVVVMIVVVIDVHVRALHEQFCSTGAVSQSCQDEKLSAHNSYFT